jgi:threonine dehydrogenase-like Zn-dependent dehydrogenase
MITEALWYLGERSMEIRETEIPEMEAHEVMEEMEVCGISGWDFPDFSEGVGEGRKRAYDVVIETAGNAASLETAFCLAKPGAIIENFAWHHHRQDFALDDWHTRGWRIPNIQPQMNPSYGALFPRTIAPMAEGAISNASLVTHVSPFARADEAHAAGLARSGGYIKGVIDFTK